MPISNLKPTTTMSHSTYVGFVREFLQLPGNIAGQWNLIVVERVRQDLVLFERDLAELVSSGEGRMIDDLEARRYYLWENIVDKIDDNLNLEIQDFTFMLSRLDLTPETARYEVPSYRASCDLLAPSSRGGDRRAFYSHLSADGHLWMPMDMDVLIGRLIDPHNMAQCESAGIAEHIPELASVERRIGELSALLPDKTLIGGLRDKRYYILLGMIVAGIRKVLGICSLKNRNHIKAWKLFTERCRECDEMRKLQVFSFSQLSLGAFFAALKRIEPDCLEKKALNPEMREEFTSDVREFTEILAAFRSHYLWERFESEETALYRETLRLMGAVTAFLPCYAADDPECWEQHSASATYQAAEILVNSLDVGPFDRFRFWEPREDLDFVTMRVMISKWDSPGNRNRLQILGALDFFDNCVRLDDSASDIAEEIQDDIPAADAGRLRMLRDKLCSFLRLVAIAPLLTLEATAT